MLQKKHNSKRKTTSLQGLYAINNKNKNYMVLVALKRNMVQKLAQPERNIKVQPNTEYRFLFPLFCSFCFPSHFELNLESLFCFLWAFFRQPETKVHVKELIVSLLSVSLARCACWQRGPSKRHTKNSRKGRESSRKGFFTFVLQSPRKQRRDLQPKHF